MLFLLDTKLAEVFVRLNFPIDEDNEAAVGDLDSLGVGGPPDDARDMTAMEIQALREDYLEIQAKVLFKDDPAVSDLYQFASIFYSTLQNILLQHIDSGQLNINSISKSLLVVLGFLPHIKRSVRKPNNYWS